jgi:hypothetical protein
MATRSTIAMEHPDGRVMQIYCHWDGYLSNNGMILHTHYRNIARVMALMMLGDLSSLRKDIGEPHDFDARYLGGDVREDWCVAYGRDRGEKDTEARVFDSFEKFNEDARMEEYNYILRLDGNWYVSVETANQWMLLEDELAEELLAQSIAADE